jgi:hypothetical protein
MEQKMRPMPGDRVYDMRTERYATVVAGAQAAGHMTVQFPEATVAVQITDLIFF